MNIAAAARDRRVSDSRPPTEAPRRLTSPGAPLLVELIRAVPLPAPRQPEIAAVINAARARREVAS